MIDRNMIDDINVIREVSRKYHSRGFNSSAFLNGSVVNTVNSYMGEQVDFSANEKGEYIYKTIDSRDLPKSHLMQLWRMKKIDEFDFNVHFYIMDILHNDEKTAEEVYDISSGYAREFDPDYVIDKERFYKKIETYVEDGLLVKREENGVNYYTMAPCAKIPSPELLRFFAEIAPCGTVGYTIEYKRQFVKSFFQFKHHFTALAFNDGVLLNIFEAISKRITVVPILFDEGKTNEIVPLKVLSCSHAGRDRVACYDLVTKEFKSIRIDEIKELETGKNYDEYDARYDELEKMRENVWILKLSEKTEHVMFELEFEPAEDYVLLRLNREKRFGKITKLSEGMVRFEADVTDTYEILPWIRTFMGWITKIELSNKEVLKVFKDDLKTLNEMYGGNDETV